MPPGSSPSLVIDTASPDALAELKSQMKTAKARFEEASTKHKIMTFRLQKWIIGLAGATTIVSGLGLLPQDPEIKEWFQAATVVLGALSTALTAWSAYRNYRDLWKLEREVYYSISDLLRTAELHEKLSDGKVPKELVLQWFASFNNVLSAAGDKWGQLFSKEQQRKNSPPASTGQAESAAQPASKAGPGAPQQA